MMKDTTFIYFTARAMGRNKDKPHAEAAAVADDLLRPLTQAQLKMWVLNTMNYLWANHMQIFL